MTTSGDTRISSSGWRWFSSPVRWVREGGAGVAALLYPAECARCGAPTTWGVVVCGACIDRLPRVEGPLCRQCGEALANPSLDLCLRCGTRVRVFDRAISLGPYDDGWRELLHAFKFAREKAVGKWFAGMLGAHARLQPFAFPRAGDGAPTRVARAAPLGQGAGDGAAAHAGRARAGDELEGRVPCGTIGEGHGTPRR
jgi:hypothetical protein